MFIPDTIHPTYPAATATSTKPSTRRPGIHVPRCQVLGRPPLGPGIVDKPMREDQDLEDKDKINDKDQDPANVATVPWK